MKMNYGESKERNKIEIGNQKTPQQGRFLLSEKSLDFIPCFMVNYKKDSVS